MTDTLPPNRPDHDGIQEHDNFLPRWWLATLFGAILFSAVYWFYYQTTGTGPSHREQLDRAEKELAALREKAGGGATDGGPDVLLAAVDNPEAIKRGGDLFNANCVACHGARGEGSIGPNLTDAYWIHGKQPQQIQKVINGGVSDKGMPAWGPSLGPAKVADAVAFVLSISNKNVPGKAPQGEKVSP